MNDYLQLKNKDVLVVGVANRKSVAYFIAKSLLHCGARVTLSVQGEEHRAKAGKLLPDCPVFCCDLERQEDLQALRRAIGEDKQFHGLVHSVAFANYPEGFVPFHETRKEDFLQAFDISCFSLINLARVFKNNLAEDASVVTISISTTRMAAENYGYMAPIKAALESSLCFLAKGFSRFSRVRFNAVCAGLLKTSASAGIPGYIDSYLFAEKATLRRRNLSTQEVADAAVFLLSPRSSGINAQRIIVDAGMETNYFDREIVERATGGD
ncbi:MAG: SDR family oxidoreductase [bacterium]|nr:SDR family oxidoreductase [bacterium]